MTPPQLALFDLNKSDNDPLPLQVAKKYNFPLQYHTTDDDTVVYAVQDWIAGLTGETSSKKVSQMWDVFAKGQTSISNRTLKLPYLATDGKTYQRDFVPDVVLYAFAAYARARKARPQIAEIKDFLAKSGAFMDALRQDPETVEVKIASLRQTRTGQIAEQSGKPAEWVAARDSGVMTRKQFTSMLMNVNRDVNIGRATNDVYKGVFGQDAAGLRKTLDIGTKENPRDHMSRLGLIYTMAAEEVIRIRLQGYGDNDLISVEDVHITVSTLARVTGTQAQEMARMVGIDLASGKPLLSSGAAS